MKGKWKYLYRGVDSKGNTIDFLLRAKRFLKKMLKAKHTAVPRVITVDNNPSYPAAVKELKSEWTLSEGCEIRRIKYLNNIVEQDHRFIKRRVKPGLGFKSFHTATRTLKGYEMMNMIRKGQCEGAKKGDIQFQIRFIENLFSLVA